MSKVICPACKGSGSAGSRVSGVDMPCGLCLRSGVIDELDKPRFLKMLGISDNEENITEQIKLEL